MKCKNLVHCIVVLAICASCIAEIGVAQENTPVQRSNPATIPRRPQPQLNRILFRLVLKGESALSGPYTVDALKALFIQRPELIVDTIKEFFPDLGKQIEVRALSGFGSDQWDDETSVIVYVSLASIISTDRQYAGYDLQVRGIPLPHDITPPEGRQLREKISRRIIEKVAAALPDFSRDYIAKRLSDSQQQLEQQLTKIRDQESRAQNDVIRSSGMPSEKYSEQLAEISRQQIAAKLSLVGMDARQKAIDNEMAKTQIKMHDSADSDDTLKSLERLLELRTERLETLKKMRDSGVAPTADMQAAEADVLSSKIELDKTRSALKRANGGEQLDAWNNELSRLAIDRAETEARLKFLGDVSAETEQQLRARRDAEKQAEEAQPKLAEAEKRIEELSKQLEEVKKSQESIEPLRVLLPDDTDDTAKSATATEADSEKTDSNAAKNAK
ncbi:MAG TPA: hypothetical protein VMJ32_03850 [Pirellulales bacterium]|nr:hypothetical protein [Pirellulales bacterium]